MDTRSPFKWRYFEAEIILLCVRWYLRYALSYRDLEEMMRERGLLSQLSDWLGGRLGRLVCRLSSIHFHVIEGERNERNAQEGCHPDSCVKRNFPKR